jgi:uncharacterized membrane protein
MLGFIAIVLVIIFYASFSSRIKKLEDKILIQRPIGNSVAPVVPSQTSISSQQSVAQTTPVATTFQQPTSIPQSTGNTQQVSAPVEKDAVTLFFAWLADEWPLKVGIFLLILAVGWFVTYAFINDWIGEVGRIALGTLFGILVLSAGFFRTTKHQLQGNALLVLGAISILISIISGIGLYNLFPAPVALVISFMLVSFMTYVALRQKNMSLAVVTVFMGSIVPMFVFSSVDISIIFLYLFVLTAGTLWVTSLLGGTS